METTKWITILILLASTTIVTAQEICIDSISPPKQLSYDTNYIHKFHNNTLAVEPWISVPTFQFLFQPKQDSLQGKQNEYEPYLQSVTGFDVSYRAVTLSVGFKSKVIPEEEDIYGKTQYSILKFRVNLNPYIFEFYHNTFSGFSDRNTRAYDSSLSLKRPYLKRQDIAVQYTKLKALYIFSKRKFSYGAAYSFTEQQKRSKASAFLVAHAYRLKTYADSGIFNNGQEGIFGNHQSLKNFSVYSIGIGPGFAGTFVEKRWFASFGIYIMADVQYHDAANSNNTLLSSGWNGTFLGDAFFSLGYNANRFYTGLVVRGDRTMISLPNMDASTIFYTAILSLGFRFDAPKIVGQLYDNSPLKYF